MSPRPRKSISSLTLSLPPSSELVSLEFELIPQTNSTLFPQYTTGLHAWFLDQVRQINPKLSQYLHDGQSEKPFTISGLEGKIETAGKKLQIFSNSTYRWRVNGLSKSVVEWMDQWLTQLPNHIILRDVTFAIQSVNFSLPPTTYQQLLQPSNSKTLLLTFNSPTSFRRKGHHFPLPLPMNVFHSYLRRWNDFSQNPYDQDSFLTWVDENVIILRHQLISMKVAAGKKGSVTGFTGAIEYGLTNTAFENLAFVQLFFTLGEFAPYCGTGHKTTFGLGQTQKGWLSANPVETSVVENLLGQRIEQLTEQLMKTQKRTGGNRAIEVCETRATILARHEFGESLKDIAEDLEIPYETVKTYAKLARKVLKESELA